MTLLRRSGAEPAYSGRLGLTRTSSRCLTGVPPHSRDRRCGVKRSGISAVVRSCGSCPIADVSTPGTRELADIRAMLRRERRAVKLDVAE